MTRFFKSSIRTLLRNPEPLSKKTGSSRLSNDEYTGDKLINGYDYHHQAWVVSGRYVRCGHPESMDCGCYGKEHEGEEWREKS